MLKGIGIDLAVHLESLERSENDVVVIRTSGHLAGEQSHHLGEIHWAVNLVQHSLS